MIVHNLFKDFEPDFIMISAGFDAGINDPLGEISVDKAFAYMLHRLSEI